MKVNLTRRQLTWKCWGYINSADNILRLIVMLPFNISRFKIFFLLVNSRHLGHLNAELFKLPFNQGIRTPRERIPQSLTKYRKQTFPIHNYVILKTLEFLLRKSINTTNDCFFKCPGDISYLQGCNKTFVLWCMFIL